jgi:YggT family protein
MHTLYYAIIKLIEVLELLILVRVFLSWVPNIRQNQIVRFLYAVTEPMLAPIRTLIERSSFGRNMMIDFSPIVVFILLGILKNILARIFLVGVWFA